MKAIEEIGKELSAIINQDGDDVTDGEVVDQIVEYLEGMGIYHKRGMLPKYPDTISIVWGVNDLEYRASNIEEDEGADEPIYDRSRFHYALERMKYSHDCCNGITWDTVDFCLDEYCKF